MPVNLSAELTWEIGGGYERNVKVTVRDTSKNGMALLAPLPFPIGAAIRIAGGNITREAIVRHCVKHGLDHILGVQFQR
jgi:hypothetical protein